MSLVQRLRPDGVSGPVVAIASAVGALGGAYAVAGPTPAFVVAPVNRAVLALTPDPVLAVTIQRLGEYGKLVGLAVALGLTIAAFAAVAAVGVRVGQRAASRYGLPLGAALGVGLGHLLLAIPLGADLAAVAAGLAGALVVALATPQPATVPVSVARRRAIRAVGGAAALASVGAAVGSRRSSQGGEDPEPSPFGPNWYEAVDDPQVRGLLSVADSRSFDLPGTDRLVTRPDEFYEVDISTFNPEIDRDEWSLEVTGAVEDELELSFEDVRAFPAEHRFVTLRCVGEPLNGTQIDTALWTGARMADVLERAGAGEDCCVMLWAEDDYYEEFPLSALRDGLLAYRMDGADLPVKHGFPARALVPGHWGEVNVKWVTEIEVLDEPATGYWEERGWHGTGPVNTVAKLHSITHRDDGRIAVGGHAYAGTRGIQRVEVSIDNGETWEDAALTERLPGRVSAAGETIDPGGYAEDAWRQWRHVYDASEPHVVVVRATDGTGAVQPPHLERAFPSGAAGWVRQRVQA